MASLLLALALAFTSATFGDLETPGIRGDQETPGICSETTPPIPGDQETPGKCGDVEMPGGN